MSQPSPDPLRVQSHGLTLPLFKLGETVNSPFTTLVLKLRDYSFERESRKRAIKDETDIGRIKACVLFIEGLYQAYCSNMPDAAVAFPHNQGAYNKNQSFLIRSHSYRQIDATYKALIGLGWVTFCPGFKRADGQTRPTSVAPTGDLLDCFRRANPTWRKVTFTSDPIIVRIKTKQKKVFKNIAPPDTPQVHTARSNCINSTNFSVIRRFALVCQTPNSRL